MAKSCCKLVRLSLPTLFSSKLPAFGFGIDSIYILLTSISRNWTEYNSFLIFFSINSNYKNDQFDLQSYWLLEQFV
jgi:hypothetical protein